MTHFKGAEEGWWRENLVRCGPGDRNPTRAYPSTHRNIRGKPEPSHGRGCRILKGRAVTAEHVLSLAAHSHSPAGASGLPNQTELEEERSWLEVHRNQLLQPHLGRGEWGFDLVTRDYGALETKQIDCFTNSHCYVKPPSLHTSAVLF